MRLVRHLPPRRPGPRSAPIDRPVVGRGRPAGAKRLSSIVVLSGPARSVAGAARSGLMDGLPPGIARETGSPGWPRTLRNLRLASVKSPGPGRDRRFLAGLQRRRRPSVQVAPVDAVVHPGSWSPAVAALIVHGTHQAPVCSPGIRRAAGAVWSVAFVGVPLHASTAGPPPSARCRPGMLAIPGAGRPARIRISAGPRPESPRRVFR